MMASVIVTGMEAISSTRGAMAPKLEDQLAQQGEGERRAFRRHLPPDGPVSTTSP
jgi:hypothetical protein